MNFQAVRLRFAPSPTGPLHIGGVRTALFNYLFVKKHGGQFILRIEDTDQKRYVEGAEAYIMEALRWCGLHYDEGPDVGGPYGPYRQSERKAIYREYADLLVARGWAYHAFDTEEELEQMRERLKAEKSDQQQYGPTTRGQMRNALTLGPERTAELLAQGVPSVIRFRMPEGETVLLEDIIRGQMAVNTNTLDDKVLFKADGMPTYHLANIVDDHLMRITHVVRGEEWLPSLALHVLLYRAFGWEETMPRFAHLPLILKPNGKGKLSKRDGDALGFPVFPLEWTDPSTGERSSGYREWGYLPPAFANMLALLGWNPGTEQELFSLDELAGLFDLAKVSKSGAKFDPDKTKWFNQQYMRHLPEAELARLARPLLEARGWKASDEHLLKVCGLLRERLGFASELLELGSFFFEAPTDWDAAFVKKKWKLENGANVAQARAFLAEQADFAAPALDAALKAWMQERQIGMGALLPHLRVCLVGTTAGPDLLAIVETLGKEEVLARLDRALAALPVA